MKSMINYSNNLRAKLKQNKLKRELETAEKDLKFAENNYYEALVNTHISRENLNKALIYLIATRQIVDELKAELK